MSAQDNLSPHQFESARAAWEGDNSMDITAEAAKLAGSPHGWSTMGTHIPALAAQLSAHAHTLMSAARPVDHPLYHGVPASHRHAVGDEITVPLRATSKTRATAEDFAQPNGPEEHTIYEFRPGALGTPINKDEHVVTGKYRVTAARANHVVLERHDSH